MKKRLLFVLVFVMILAACTAPGEFESPAPGLSAPDAPVVSEYPVSQTSAPDGICAARSKAGSLAQVSDADYFANFTPMLRFAVASDVHITDTGRSILEEGRLADLFEAAYAYADSHPTYTGLDGVFFAGDVSDRGTQAGLDRFFAIARENCRPGTVLRATMGNHEYYDDAARAERTFLAASGYEAVDGHLTLGGCHFLFLSPDQGGNGYSQAKQDFLAQALAEAAADDPTGCRPIFVFQHHPVSDTVYGSHTGWGVEELAQILAEHPQVVDFSGHSHFPINDPRSIWQGSFTALGCGTLSYYEMDLVGVKEDYIFPTNQFGDYAESASGRRDAAQFYLVEVDQNNALRILGYDLLSGDQMMAPLELRCVDETVCYRYTDHRAQTGDVPVFALDAAVTETVHAAGRITLSFPQAACADLVQNYRCTLYAGAEALATEYRLSCSCFLPTPETLPVTFGGLTAGTEYRVEIIAVSPWGKESQPLCYTFTA